MNINKRKYLAAALLSAAVLGGGAAQAADSRQSYKIELEATIPSDTFQILPVESGWINQKQEMVFNFVTKKLQPFEKQFQYKNTAGAIQASLTTAGSDGKAILSNGNDKDNIPLTVTFNGIELGNTAVTVVTEADAKAGGRTALRISQAGTGALTANGSFTGTVAMLFEPVVTKP